MNWYLEVLKKYAVFSGRARRKEYWMFFLIYTIIYLVLAAIDAILTAGLLSTLYIVATLIPAIAVTIRRLHDIGRRFGVAGMRHVMDGYYFLCEEGYEGAARICLTHSYPVKEQVVGASPWDGSPQEHHFLSQYLDGIEYDDYDRLIQLLDALSLPTGFCLMEKRLLDVVMRFGVNDHTVSRWQGFFEVKAHIEQAIGGSIYRLLPGVIENTFEWGEDGDET